MTAPKKARPARKPARAAGVGSGKALRSARSSSAKTKAEKAPAKPAAGTKAVFKTAAIKKAPRARAEPSGGTVAMPAMAEPPEKKARRLIPTRSAVDRLADAPVDLPATGRLMRVIEHEIDAISRIVSGARPKLFKHSEAERRARMLGTLARVLTELRKTSDDASEAANRDDDRPRDIDELRRRLQERLARMVRSGAIVPDRGNEEGRILLPR